MQLPPPFLSVFDPDVSQEGTVDPLTLQALAERLAERIFPWITSRMSRIRFVTAICAGSVVCEAFEDEMAADGVTPPWLVFEWHVVEALLRQRLVMETDGGWGRGLPGFRKVKAVVEGNHRLGATSYLKTPTVFGFTGVYRRIAFGSMLVDDEIVISGEGGSLLEAWEEDKGLSGFRLGTGEGGSLRREMEKAVRDALKKGFTDRPGSWPSWEKVADVFRPDQPGRRERQFLLRSLSGLDGRGNQWDPEALAMRHELLAALVDGGVSVDRASEPAFFRMLAGKASDPLRLRLNAIDAYEGLCALLTDGFFLILALSTEREERPVDEKTFSAERLAGELARDLPGALEKVERAFGELKSPEAVEGLLQRYSQVKDPGGLFRSILEHHHTAQENKPPDGKRPWVETVKGGVVARPAYRREATRDRNTGYVHDYRSSSASSFLRDLQAVPS